MDWLAGVYGNLQKEGILNGQAYQNYPVEVYTPEEALHKYYGSNLCRLVAAKRRYDPGNVFAPAHGALPLSLPECEAAAQAA